jgi:hypothetical protein
MGIGPFCPLWPDHLIGLCAMRLRRISLRMRWIALVVLVTAGWLSPECAQASCGDYVTMTPHPDGSPSPQMQPTTHQPTETRTSTPASRHLPIPVAPRPTCRGAACIPPVAPVTTAKPTTTPRDDVRALVDAPRATTDSPLATILALCDFERNPGYPSSIYHPPR